MSYTTESYITKNSELTVQGKVISLFQYIKELNKLKQKSILNINDYPWHFYLSNLPDDHENIKVFYRDRIENEDDDIGDILVSVHKPEFQNCPEPDEIIKEWLKPGWNNFRESVMLKDGISHNKLIDKNYSDEQNNQFLNQSEEFYDNEERTIAFNKWIKLRDEWVERQKTIKMTRQLFSDLYSLYFELQRDSETMEIIVANGMLCDSNNPKLHHPVLTHRVKLNYNADENTVFIEDTNKSSELYFIAFQLMNDVNLSVINKLNEELHKYDYHPLDRNDTPGFLKVLAHQLSSKSIFSEKGVPLNWQNNNRILIYLEPCYIVRKRIDGTMKAVEKIIENIQQNGEIPEPIREIVSGGKVEIPEVDNEETIEQQLAAVGGESIDILLSKEANREQLEIAKRIEKYSAVLVQGPPGTGKTHTIANLMGHFFAQGKSVLVTSYTAKALSVLKGKIVPGLQNLCVSVLDDSNIDMERSVDGIIDYMSKTTSYEIKRKMDSFALERNSVIKRLADVRRKIFYIINQECNCIVYNGEEISPSKAAEFVVNHADELSYIPGKVRMNYPLPLSFEQLIDLYRSNEKISRQDEIELANDVPSTKQIPTPSDFELIVKAYSNAQNKLARLQKSTGWIIENNIEDRQIYFRVDFKEFTIGYPDKQSIYELKKYIVSYGNIEKWMKYISVDGKKGGSYRQRWIILCEQINKTCQYAESIVNELFGLNINFDNSIQKEKLRNSFIALKEIYNHKGKVSKLTLMLHKDYADSLEKVTINGRKVKSEHECDIILHCIELDNLRSQCEIYWNELLSIHDVPSFYDLDVNEQERVAINWIPSIMKYIDWYQTEYDTLINKLSSLNIPSDIVFNKNVLDSELVATEKILQSIKSVLPQICDICEVINKIEECIKQFNNIRDVMNFGKRCNSLTCKAIVEAVETENSLAYAEAYAALDTMYSKYSLQNKRFEMLKIIDSVAPQWAEAIRNRIGIHGSYIVPNNIEDAWKWKQLSQIIDDITSRPFSELQEESLRLSKEYRQITANYAVESGWYHLLKRTEGNIDMRQALQGWKLTVKQIGKGTGKNAPKLKEKARELMSQCQSAVPAWIMPINRALESLNPKENIFDIIIIDEASQADLSSLAILYMGKKLIIVGDDKQVSPMGVGAEIDKMNALEEIYLKDKIPNSQLYNAKTSIYDIAATTFQPLMLREHFRCVPEIIGFSNMLSYNYKIKPLRDASSSNLLPAIVNYRVLDGKRESGNKTNINEAKAIVALMQSCIEQDEYNGKTFGVISLLGDEQVKVIQRLIEENIDSKDIIQRNISCGISSKFQGDERDVIFLSVVDSGDGQGPIHLQGYGTNDSMRKRYNVATSRAKDQLWVVHSLDSANDLKPGDIRKILIDYASNPQAEEIKIAKVKEKSESPFELAVATELIKRGYHIVQQWKVGAYRIDMVAVCGKKTVAIECDGERWHSGEVKIREDMERQTILERIGWRFIRIRGSEYYRHPDLTIERVIHELKNYDIEAEEQEVQNSEIRNSELLNRVKNCALKILNSKKEDLKQVDLETISVALNPKIVMSNASGKFSMGELSRDNTVNRNSSIHSGFLSNIQDTASDCNSNKKENNSVPIQQVLKGMEDMVPDADDIISLLKKHNVNYIDNRKNKGALWIFGGHELDDVVRKARTLGIYFKFRPEGGRVTKGKASWWAK